MGITRLFQLIKKLEQLEEPKEKLKREEAERRRTIKWFAIVDIN